MNLTFNLRCGSAWAAVVAIIILLAIYFPIAFYLNANYVQPDITLLHPPFRHLAGNAFASYKLLVGSQADTAANPQQSTVVVFEDGKPMSRLAHSSPSDVNEIGEGRYTYWKGTGDRAYLIFSASDNSNPSTNRRVYRVVDPKARDPYQAQRKH